MKAKKVKINIIGASGTGKSTLAKALSHRIGCVYFDSDDYYHYPTDPPFRKQRSPDERLALLMSDLNRHDSWVLSGGAVYGNRRPQSSISHRIFIFGTVDPIERLRRREIRLYDARIENGGDMAADHLEFMKWTAGYDDGSAEGTNTLPRHLRFLTECRCQVLKIEKPMATEDQVTLILSKLGMD